MAFLVENEGDDRHTVIPNPEQESSCDDERVLRNEANGLVRCPLSVVRGALPDVGFPVESSADGEVQTEAASALGSHGGSPARDGSAQVLGTINAPNEPTVGPLSVVSGPLPVGSCVVRASWGRRGSDRAGIGPWDECGMERWE